MNVPEQYCRAAAWRTISCAYIFLSVQDTAIGREDDDGLFDWSGGDGDDIDLDDDGEDDDELSPVQVDEMSAGKMIPFFAKLNSLRRKRLLDRRKSASAPFGNSHGRPSPGLPDGDRLVTAVAGPSPEAIHTLSAAPETPLSLPDRETSGKEVNRRTGIDEGGWTTAIGNHDVAFGIRNISKEEKATKTPDAGSTRKNRRRHRVAGYLDMGWYSARCLWTQYLNAVDEQEVLAVREKIMRFAMFWTAVVGVSIAFLWCAFGCFHELFCIGVIEPPVTYAKDVNKYLTIVPPHVVVTNKGKMFRYRPTAEERFIWSSAKKISNFKI